MARIFGKWEHPSSTTTFNDNCPVVNESLAAGPLSAQTATAVPCAWKPLKNTLEKIVVSLNDYG
jgi:hypothetical protein